MPEAPVLIPDQPTPFDQVQRFFFEQILGDGTKDKLNYIMAHFEEETVSGLRFGYESNQSRSIGNTGTDNYQTVNIGGDEIIYFSVTTKESAIVELEVCYPIFYVPTYRQ